MNLNLNFNIDSLFLLFKLQLNISKMNFQLNFWKLQQVLKMELKKEV